ncbi:uncharacterized protein LOC144168807 isoform X2 [Haemaphysalis longicornis]
MPPKSNKGGEMDAAKFRHALFPSPPGLQGINSQSSMWAGLLPTSLASLSRLQVQLACLAQWHCRDPPQVSLQAVSPLRR